MNLISHNEPFQQSDECINQVLIGTRSHIKTWALNILEQGFKPYAQLLIDRQSFFHHFAFIHLQAFSETANGVDRKNVNIFEPIQKSEILENN